MFEHHEGKLDYPNGVVFTVFLPSCHWHWIPTIRRDKAEDLWVFEFCWLFFTLTLMSKALFRSTLARGKEFKEVWWKCPTCTEVTQAGGWVRVEHGWQCPCCGEMTNIDRVVLADIDKL
jgi:hypothetical protein